MSGEGTEDVTDTEHPLHPQSLGDKYFPMILQKAQHEWARTHGNV